MSTEGGMRAVLAALIANLGIAISKFVAFVITGSTSMLSEAIHSTADSLNQVLLLVGSKKSQRKADDKFQFGYGRLRYVYGFVVAIVLFIVGGSYSLYEGWHKVHNPHPVDHVVIAIGVLVVAIVLEAFSFRTAIIEANKARGHRTMGQFIRDAREPELPVILLEDFGALIGLVLALVGVILAHVTHDGRWDGLGAIAIGLLLIVIAIVLVREMASMLIGESALPEEEQAVRKALESAPLVERIIHLRTLHVGPEALLVAVKIAISPDRTSLEIVQGIDQAEAILRKAVPNAEYVFIEPDHFRE
ncbi:MAG: cation diffusion facilitator family transporter [Actinomycetes bacterium]